MLKSQLSVKQVQIYPDLHKLQNKTKDNKLYAKYIMRSFKLDVCNKLILKCFLQQVSRFSDASLTFKTNSLQKKTGCVCYLPYVTGIVCLSHRKVYKHESLWLLYMSWDTVYIHQDTNHLRVWWQIKASSHILLHVCQS